MGKAIIAIIALVAVTACSGDRGLRRLDPPGAGPDEFSVLPSAPLEMPESYANLPAPTPGGNNLADPNPLGEAVVALGGNPNAVQAGGIPAGDRALVAQAGRNGVDPSIRATLAQEDQQFRNRRARFGLFNLSDRYYRAYTGQALDAYAELIRFRNLGVAVPSAPPAN